MYTPQIYYLKDHNDNTRHVQVQHDTLDNTYVANIRGGGYERMADGSQKQPIVATGVADTPLDSAKCAIQNLLDRALKQKKADRAFMVNRFLSA